MRSLVDTRWPTAATACAAFDPANVVRRKVDQLTQCRKRSTDIARLLGHDYNTVVLRIDRQRSPAAIDDVTTWRR